ncbi:MAG: DNRLRE domain-containing protein [Chloroflexi bacterium]|nr:DNRLRE domain-containing protein [Chloroflexota bacterium]
MLKIIKHRGHKLAVIIGLVLLAFMGGISLFTSGTAVAAITTTTIIADSDAVVRGGQDANTNFGDSTILATANVSDTYSFIRFDIPETLGPFHSATLRLYALGFADPGFAVHQVSDNSWQEATITHNNAPAVGATIASLPHHWGNRWVEIDITDHITTSGQVSLAILNTRIDEAQYYSRESGEYAPQLVVEADDSGIPTITTMVNADRDAVVRADGPDEGEALTIATSNVTDTISYLHFVVPEFSPPIYNATLRLYALDIADPGFELHQVTDNDWYETTITYENAPSIGPIVAASPRHWSNEWVEIDVTAYITASGEVSFALLNSQIAEVEYYSRESGAYAPQLIIEADDPDTSLINAESDAVVWSAFPDVNEGNTSTIATDNVTDTISFIRFDVPEFETPIYTATLRLYALDVANLGFELHQVTDNNWNELDITYNTKPFIGAKIAESPQHWTNEWVEIDVTAYVTESSEISFALINAQIGEVRYLSRESGSGPQITIWGRQCPGGTCLPGG